MSGQGAKTTPADIWREYEQGRAFNMALGLYEQVEKNEYFYTGDQWHGVNAPNLDKPVINILARPVKYFVSTIVSDDIGVSVTEFDDSEDTKPALDMLGAQFDEIMELCEFKKKARELIRDSAVDGDGVMHYYFDPDAPGRYGAGLPAEDGQSGAFVGTPGRIMAELVENTNLLFGNPQLADVQGQPYLLLVFRRVVDEVRRQAKEAGRDAEAIQPDENQEKHGDAPETGKVTVVRKYWKQEGENGRESVWFCEVTAGAVVRPATDTGYSRYPVAYMPWEKVKHSFHGQAAITPLIANQIFVNKLFAMSMQHVKMMAFPKIVYNRSLLPGGWNNRVGEAIGVPGDPATAVAVNFRAQDMSSQVLQMIDTIINYTRETMGVSDAALGNVKPDNTSAIVATQKATSMPLELQKQAFYSFVEDSVRIWLDMMAVNYGVRMVHVEQAGFRRSGPGGHGVPDGYGEMQAQPATARAGGLPPSYALREEAPVRQPAVGMMSVQGMAPMPDPVGPTGPLGTMPGAGMMPVQGIAPTPDPVGPTGPLGAMPGTAGEAQTETVAVPFDFSQLAGMNLHLNVDIGAATYWSELMQVQTLDALFSHGILTDAETYLENMPRGYIPQKASLIKAIQEQKAAQAAQMQQQIQQAAMMGAQQGRSAAPAM